MQAPALPPNLKRTISLIVLHCSATPSGKRFDVAPRTTPGVIDAWHQARGFKRDDAARSAFNWRLTSIGYHYVVDLDGYIWTGRHLNEVGAHVAGKNAHSVGICLVGGAEPMGRYTPAQWESLRGLVQQLQAGIDTPTGRQLTVVGHRDLSPDADGDGLVEKHEWLKTCPGFDVSLWLGRGMTPQPENIYEAR